VSLQRATPEQIPGGDPQQNAETAYAILDGVPGPPRDLAVLNAGAAIYAGGRADSLPAGVSAAQEAIDSGRAAAALKQFVAKTQELGGTGT
jgi:anthranilate phosphoribosyltransferase